MIGSPTTSPSDGREQPAVQLVEITKAYPGVLANDRISLAVRRGEVHCLLGENGAGKSTLMNILSGMVRPDSGEVRLEGRHAEIHSPKHAIELGIGMVYQHSSLVPQLNVLENLMLGEAEGIRLNASAARERLRQLGGSIGLDVDPGATTGTLALGQQQQLEIIKALWRGSKVLILDEPTSMLTPKGVAELEQIVSRLKGQGLAVVFITHKLHEAISMGDRVAILSQGRLVGAIEPDELRSATHDVLQERIIALMFGGQAAQAADVAELTDEVEWHAPRRVLDVEPALELEAVTVEPGPGEIGTHDVSLQVLKSEIMGIAGVDGNGQRELAEAIAGQRSLAAGDIRLFGHSLAKFKVAQREKLGLRYVTDDRLHEGTVGSLSVAMNLVLKQIGKPPFWERGRIRYAAILDKAQQLISGFDIRTPGPETRVAALSGGNIQKVVLARELSFDPKVVIYSKPTYGLDVRTTRSVRQTIREQAREGVTSVVISTDLDELLDLCDRIAVLSRGRITGVVNNGPNAQLEIGELMVGGRAA
ncbi:MAG: ABC transporter ATP-binding protein [Thermoleophilia bacterium]|nr:ABC transporter ATP-binding protein [Thermoleophilia bacterium]